jgi:acetoin utilization deacetylase AcuC-like enzyme
MKTCLRLWFRLVICSHCVFVLVAVSVLVGRNRNAFCVVRPPGHHAGVNGLLDGGESCGFCIFNNVAAGALYAISDDRLLCDRCAIVDIDVHHGNGTEEIVQKCHDPSKLFFFSIHLYDNEKKKRGGLNSAQYKFYPGTGSEDDLAMNIINVPIVPLWKEQASLAAPAARTHNTRQKKTRSSADSQDESPIGTPRSGNGRSSDGGSETGSTTTHNNNLSPRGQTINGLSGRLAYRKAIQDRLLPALRAFNPDLILISAGFDACKGDVGNARHERGGKERLGLDLEPEDYAWTTNKILEIADICCQGRVVSVLEGGYGRTTVPSAAAAAAPPTAAGATGNNNATAAAAAAFASDQQTLAEEASLDRTIFADCAIRHLHAMIDPYDIEHRFTPIR